MKMLNGKIIFRVSLVCLVFLMAPMNGFGKLFLETDTATGIVTDVTNGVITLESGVKYYPATDNMNPDADVKVGEPITLRFFTDSEQKNRYAEIADGKNSLPKMSAPKEKERGFK